MPPKKCTDPEILAARRQRAREGIRMRMRKHREKVKKSVTEMLGAALATVADKPSIPTGEHQSLAARTAQAVLKSSLQRHGVTADRIVRVVSEGLDSMRIVGKGEDIASQPDMQHRLRASDTALKLLERAGEVPGLKHAAPASAMTVNVLIMPEDNSKVMRTIEAERADE